MDYRENYKLWLEEKSLDPKLRAELEAIADDPREQEERFYTELEFSTAGRPGRSRPRRYWDISARRITLR